MEDELKNVISEAMNNSSESEQEQTAASTEELSEEALDTVAGGACLKSWVDVCVKSWFRNASNKA